MQTTMNLLDEALKLHPAPYWHKKLGLTRTVLHTAKIRGNLSPAIAGALAEEMGEPVEKWIVIAALESERESACKSRMVRKFITGAALAGTLMGSAGAATVNAATQYFADSKSVYYVNKLLRAIRRQFKHPALMLRIA